MYTWSLILKVTHLIGIYGWEGTTIIRLHQKYGSYKTCDRGVDKEINNFQTYITNVHSYETITTSILFTMAVYPQSFCSAAFGTEFLGSRRPYTLDSRKKGQFIM